MYGIVRSGEIPGILAYVSGEAVGWCAVARRGAGFLNVLADSAVAGNVFGRVLGPTAGLHLGDGHLVANGFDYGLTCCGTIVSAQVDWR